MEEAPISKSITLEEEVKLLRSQIREHQIPSPYHTITKIILNKPASLEMYKSIVEKERLLDEAISSGNGDAILFVIKFLVRTLKKKFVHRILQVRPKAVQHYLNYLTLRLQVTDCTDLLIMLGKHQEAAVSI
jgi:VPS33B-interacting protein in polarity and apical restriction